MASYCIDETQHSANGNGGQRHIGRNDYLGHYTGSGQMSSGHNPDYYHSTCDGCPTNDSTGNGRSNDEPDHYLYPRPNDVLAEFELMSPRTKIARYSSPSIWYNYVVAMGAAETQDELNNIVGLLELAYEAA